MPAISGNKFVVVGGASLLGSHIGDQLLAAGSGQVVLFDNLALGSTDNIKALLKDSRCTFLRGDVLRLNELLPVFEGASGIFAVAGFLTKPLSMNPAVGLDVNIRGLQNILDASRQHKNQKVIFSSSTGVYGIKDRGVADETAPLKWQGLPAAGVLYCASKVLGEGLGRLYHDQHGIEFVSLRYSAIFGERLHTRALDATRMVEVYENVRAGQAPVVDGDGSAVQDYVYVGDVARANLLAMERGASSESYNIVSGLYTSVSRVVDLVIKACDSDLTPTYRVAKGPAVEPQEQFSYSREKAKKDLGWEPSVSIDQGVHMVVDWLDKERAVAATH
jgi:UDP-glucose 4-epimerase